MNFGNGCRSQQWTGVTLSEMWRAFFETPSVGAAISPWRDGGTRPDLVWTDRDSNLMSIINWRDPAAEPPRRE